MKRLSPLPSFAKSVRGSLQESVQFSPKGSHGVKHKSVYGVLDIFTAGMEQIGVYFLTTLPEHRISLCIPTVVKQEAFQRAAFAITIFGKRMLFWEHWLCWLLCWKWEERLQWVVFNLSFSFKQHQHAPENSGLDFSVDVKRKQHHNIWKIEHA